MAIARADLFDTAEWPLLQTLVVAICVALHPLERWLRFNLPRLQRTCAQSMWAPHLEGIGLGLVIAAAIAASGTGGEFIYFQF